LNNLKKLGPKEYFSLTLNRLNVSLVSKLWCKIRNQHCSYLWYMLVLKFKNK